MEEKRNFEQDLVDLVQYTDPLLIKLQDAYINARGTSFLGALIKGPIVEFKTLFGFLKKQKFEIVPLLITGPLAIVAGYMGWNSQLLVNGLGQLVGVQYTNYALIVIVTIAWYLVTMVLHFFRMADPNSKHFHIGVYQILRKSEFRAFSPFLKESRNRFSFAAMKDWFYSQGGYAELFFARKEWDKMKEKYEQLITVYDAELRAANAERDELIRTKNTQLLYLSKILGKAKTNIERLVNDRFGITDLDFFCPYTLYELNNDKLVLIADVGTGANAKAEILLHEHPDFISVQVLTHHEPFKYQRISKNRTILSYRMDMPDDKVWVINLHINETDEILLEFFFGSAIIEAPELLEVVQAYCRLLKKYVLDVSDGKSFNQSQRTGTTGRDI
ncbi:hypothetical protein QO009_003028 [Brevibacillus aydinogluensis]|jgi:hypothetical protein|uniref:hypothetical protein n=1 Tax=Brevibacillus aydinogluensis TaxID=927786 RepID=UPI002892B605|nr:hypothetical protein [Brevibacillus aydinogluensis]MDT3417133.1 hypothetical protein [Brevibacillus aydinogluensis]